MRYQAVFLKDGSNSQRFRLIYVRDTGFLSVNQDYDRWSIETPADSHTLYIDVKREGEVNGIHSVTARSTADQLVLSHEAFNRQGFALGALAAAQFLIGKVGCFGMEDLFSE